ncbi:hypothetical protein M5689_001078 [Euphorbia peplus]|nr:hypothetical protein M5689_001078 [Euphorbia peplus]
MFALRVQNNRFLSIYFLCGTKIFRYYVLVVFRLSELDCGVESFIIKNTYTYGLDNRWKSNCSCLSSWLDLIRGIYPRDVFIRIIAITWLLWFYRNIRVHGGQVLKSNLDFLEKADSLLSDRGFSVSPDLVLAPAVSQVAAPRVSWVASIGDAVKLNVDASWVEDRCGGVGAVLRNNSGVVLLAAGGPFTVCSSPEVAEMHAALFGLRVANEAGWREVVLELDCLNIVQAFRGIGEVDFFGSVIFEDLRQFFTEFRHIELSHTQRDGNVLAHELAKWGGKLADSSVLSGEVPSELEGYVRADFCS